MIRIHTDDHIIVRVRTHEADWLSARNDRTETKPVALGSHPQRYVCNLDPFVCPFVGVVQFSVMTSFVEWYFARWILLYSSRFFFPNFRTDGRCECVFFFFSIDELSSRDMWTNNAKYFAKYLFSKIILFRLFDKFFDEKSNNL